MSRVRCAASFVAMIAVSYIAACAYAAAATPEDAVSVYKRAESLLPGNLRHHMYIPDIKPHWVNGDGRFWYLKKDPTGKHFVLVDAATGGKGLAFNHKRLAAAVSDISGHVYQPDELPFKTFRFVHDGKSIRFATNDSRWTWQCSLGTYKCQRKPGRSGAGGRVQGVVSPNGEWEAFVRDHNLYVRSLHGGKTFQLTKNGRARNDYARPLAGLKAIIARGKRRGVDAPLRAAVSWSPDSTRLIAYRLDSTHTQRIDVTQFVPPGSRLRPITYSYALSMPGQAVSHAYPVIFKVGSKPTQMPVKTDPLLVPYQRGPQFRWSKDGKHIFYLYAARGDKYVELREIDAGTGKQRVVHRETADPYPYVAPQLTTYRFVEDGRAFLWTSERSGWNQIYLYDLRSGKLLRRVTDGDWNVQKIVRVDGAAGQVYFTANGVDPKLNPYFTQFYRVNLDGTGMTLLTPGNANHAVHLSPGGKYFVDNHSRPDVPGASVLRRTSDGTEVKALEQGDSRWLASRGWTAPIAFEGLAADGETKIHGVIFRPPHFNPTKKYPVVENVYPGPNRFREPITFRQGLREQRMAALGFVVVLVDGRGSAGRSRAFRSFSYRNIAGALVDHVALIKQMAHKYPWFDLDRVGVYGTSEGGYATAQAMLMFPDFYKVGVATSGNYITLMTKAVYSERYQGYPVGDNYISQSSDTLASKLEGRLLLIQGDIDPNVNAAQMLHFTDALMSAGKDFDMLLVPNMEHGDSGPHRWYVMRRRWNYFFRHLAGRAPPEHFRIRAGG